MKTLTFEIVGTTPLICHNERLADPLNEYAMAIHKITSKSKKTPDDHREIGYLEFTGGLYLNEDGAPAVPGANLETMLRNAARTSKRGKDIEAGLRILGMIPVNYEGPKDPEKMWKSAKFAMRCSVGVRGSRVMRTRPIFEVWGLGPFEVDYDEHILSDKLIQETMALSGRRIGLGERRPKYGLFEVINGKG